MKENPTAFPSANYDEKIRKTLPYYEEFYRQILDVISIDQTGPITWLDVGCGTGKMAEMAFGKVNIDQFVFCDCSLEMIQIAKKRFSGPNTSFLISSVEEIGNQGYFDVVTAVQVNHYLHREARQKAVENCYRALKAGGLFFTFENIAPFGSIGEQLYLKRWESYQAMQGKDKIACAQHMERYKKEYFPITITEHLELMRASGFETVEVLWVSYMQAGFLGIK